MVDATALAPDVATSAQLLPRLLAVQVLEKVLRFERLLDKSRVAAVPSDREVVRTFRDQLNAIREDVRLVIKKLGPFNEEMGASTSPTPRHLVRLLVESFHALDRLHLHLSYVTGQFDIPEARAFIAGLTDRNYDLLDAQDRFTVILSDTYMFEETDLVSYFAAQTQNQRVDRESPTLFLPKLEADNPLQWGCLVHEVGHALAKPISEIFTEDEILSVVRPAVRGGAEVVASWTEEVFCDLFALRLLGPAYLATFIEFIILIGSEGFLELGSKTHPPPRFRIWLMLSVLEKANIVADFQETRFRQWTDLGQFYYAMFEERCRIEREHLGAKLGPDLWSDLVIDFGPFRELLERKLEELVPIDGAVKMFDSRKFKHLYERLNRGIPIGSFSRRAVEEPHLASKIDSADQGLEKLRSLVGEGPCTVAEIVNAGWLYKCEAIYRGILPSLGRLTISDEQEFGDRLAVLDELLRSSVETSYMHSLLTRPS